MNGMNGVKIEILYFKMTPYDVDWGERIVKSMNCSNI
jgi:hypothetical protein